MSYGHYQPKPQDRKAYHHADEKGLGYDRTSSGSNAVSQYHPPLSKRLDQLSTCPEEYLLWFHHVPWNYKMKSGRTLWGELCQKYNAGVSEASDMLDQWHSIKGQVDPEIFQSVSRKLETQVEFAKGWRDACLKYFQTFSHMPF